MLTHLSIRNIVLIEKLDLEFGPGLWVLTGETGAGKSILLDALGLAVGGRADKSLVRHKAEEGAVTAEFHIKPDHAVWSLLDQLDLEYSIEDPILLRRVLKSDGRSKAFLNDQPVSVSTLTAAGSMLLEVHGQHAERDILEPSAHREFLDTFAGNGRWVHATRAAHENWRDAVAALDEFRRTAHDMRTDRDYYNHAVDELQSLAAEDGEEDALAQARVDMMGAEKVAEDLSAVEASVCGPEGAVHRVAQAYRALVRAEQKAPTLLQPVIEALDKASLDLEEVETALTEAQRAAQFDPNKLETIEERLFALRAASRKYKVEVSSLPALLRDYQQRLAKLENLDTDETELVQHVDAARKTFEQAAANLSKERSKAAKKLDTALKTELKPLKLDKARFRTRIEALPLDNANDNGLDRIHFEISTNPEAPFGPLTQIASGGEFARFVLALKAIVAEKQTKAIVVFDEVDQGVGGAVAEAVGERLSRLSAQAQVLVITHSPQVAACGHHHLQISKKTKKAGGTQTQVKVLDAAQRLEEIARMLSGARITDEARAAAARLLESAAKPLKTGTSGQ